MTDLNTFEIRDQATIRDAILRVIRNALIGLGVTSPNVGPNSDWYILATAVANEAAVAEANGVIKADELMPDTAVDVALDRWLATVKLTRRAASGSTGNVTLSATQAATIPAGTTLIDSAGLLFQTRTTAAYADGDPVEVEAVSTGRLTNHSNGDVLQWVAVPAFANPTVSVGLVGGTDGLDGGYDDETDEPARTRLFARLANPPGSGNWQHVAELAEASDPHVEKGFVYPAAQGPSTVHVAVTQFSTSHLGISGASAFRDVDATILSTRVAPYIKGLLPTNVDVTVTTVTNLPTAVSIALSLPAAPNASPAGPGGGWLDGTPWPNVSGTGFTAVHVSSVTSSTVILVDAPTPPQVGVSRIAYVNSNTWTLYTATVIGSSGSGPYTLTLDRPLVGINASDFIFPQCLNQQAYVTALLKAFGQMGPGEKSTLPAILERGFRHPPPQQLWPATLDAFQLRAISDAGPEVLSAQWLFREHPLPFAPTLITDPPVILVPKQIAFYPL